jgi:HSP20 family protein
LTPVIGRTPVTYELRDAATEAELDTTHLFLVRHGAQPTVDPQVNRQFTWQPAVDMYRCAEGWLIKLELAGVREEDVHVEADTRGITVSGVRRDVRHFERQEAHLMEIAYSRFERLVPFPEPIGDAQLVVELRDGMMYVRALSMKKKDG